MFMVCCTYLILPLNMEFAFGIDFEVSTLPSDVPVLTAKASGSAVE